jgi:hypothetical protein
VPRVAAGADEVVERQRQGLAQPGERGRVAADERGRADALGLGGQHVLERVVVGTGLVPHLVAGLAPVPGQHVALDQFQGEAQVRPGVDVRDRGAEKGGHRNLRGKDGGAPTLNMNRGP